MFSRCNNKYIVLTAYLIRVQLLGDTHSDSDLCLSNTNLWNSDRPLSHSTLQTPHDSAPLSILMTLKYISPHWWHSTFWILSPSPCPPHFYIFYYFHVTEWEVDIILIIISQLPTEFQLLPPILLIFIFLTVMFNCYRLSLFLKN